MKGSLEEFQGHTDWRYLCLVQINIASCFSSAMLQPERDLDKDCQIHRHDVRASSDETGYSSSPTSTQLFGTEQQRTVVEVIIFCCEML